MRLLSQADVRRAEERLNVGHVSQPRLSDAAVQPLAQLAPVHLPGARPEIVHVITELGPTDEPGLVVPATLGSFGRRKKSGQYREWEADPSFDMHAAWSRHVDDLLRRRFRDA